MKAAYKSTLATLALGLALGAAMPAMAATDGVKSSTESVGSLDVTLNIVQPELVWLHGLDDIALGTVQAAPDRLIGTEILYAAGTPMGSGGSDHFCLRNTLSENVKLTINVAPLTRDSGTETLNYGVVLSHPASGQTYSAVASGSTQTFYALQSSSPSCFHPSGSETHMAAFKLDVTPPQHTGTSKPVVGSYRSTVSLILAAD